MTARIAVLDYGIGNLRSAQKGLARVGADAALTADPADIEAADGLVLPGVGAVGRCLQELRSTGLDHIATAAIRADVPFLAICVGMQMLYAGSDEAPGVAGLGLIEGRVARLPDGVRCPQMQWNVVMTERDHPMFAGLDAKPWMYFVHSYVAEPTDEVVATCDYGGPQVAAVARNRLWATQFHPEKSGGAGLRLLANFVGSVTC